MTAPTLSRQRNSIQSTKETTMSSIHQQAAPLAVVPARILVALAVVSALIAGAVFAPPAHAVGQNEIASFDAGLSGYQAGGHPNAFTDFEFAQVRPATPGWGDVDPDAMVIKGGAPKDVVVELPKGTFGNPRAFPVCTVYQLAIYRCPVQSQVGFMNLSLLMVGDARTFEQAVYNMEAERGEVAKLGIRAVNGTSNAFISVKLSKRGDYRLRAESLNIFDGLPLVGVDLTIWGVPADPANDPQRGCFNQPAVWGCSSNGLTPRPFFVAPMECGVDGVTSLSVRSWAFPGDDDWVSGLSTPRQVTGCDGLSFRPTVDVRPTSLRADAASGLDVDLWFPQNLDNPTGLAAPPLKDARVVLPEGMAINPASADGLEACSDDRLNLDSGRAMSCPLGSKIGSVRATTPVLEEVLEGGLYLRPQASSDPESGDMFRLALVVENEERGISVRLPGSVRADARTGRLVTTFEENPQLPVERISLSLKSGPRAPLAMPSTCGTHEVDVRLSSWGGQRVDLQDEFEIGCGASGFAPGFEAGAVMPVGGAFSPFVARIDRPEGQQLLSGVEVELPKGVVAKLAGVELCPDAVAGDGSPGECPAGSRIGTATVAAGSGNPFELAGPVYLTGPYNGAPYGLSVQVPAKAGPFDLGIVKVRNALQVDPETAQVTVVSDPLPQIVKGVPVRLRNVDVDADRDGFTINPTSCGEKRVQATLTSTTGQAHQTGSRFQATDCQALAFEPRLAMRLTGKRQTRTGGHPGFRTTATQKPGEAGIGRVKVTMPKSIALDANNSYDPKLVCDYDKSLTADCPASSVIGKATAHTPVLDKPLAGQVHLVQGIRFGPTGNRIRTTPSLLVKLRGEVAINLRAQTTTERGTNRLVTTFPQVPDAPVSKFNLTINGGNNGILTVTRTRRTRINLCSSRQTANVQTTGHNGKRADHNTTVKTPCAKQAAKKAKRGAKRSGGRRR